jgi:hypothetical protein
MRTPELVSFCNWIDSTPLSQAIQSAKWVVPTVQTIHIVGIAAVMSSILMIDLRLLGIVGRDQPLARVASRFRPVIWWTLPVLLASGLVMIIGEPLRSLANWVFQLKMFLLILAILVTLAFQMPLAGNPSHWESTTARQLTARVIAAVSLLLWVGIVFAGRWIAYL